MTTTQPDHAVPCAHCGTDQLQDIAVTCGTCANQLAADLRTVPQLLGMLRDTAARLDRIDRPTGNDDDIRRTLDARYALTAAATPSPIGLGAADTALEVRRTVIRWTQQLIDVAVPPRLPECAHPTCEDPWTVGPSCEVMHRAVERHARRAEVRRGLADDPARWLADRTELIRRQAWAAQCATEIARITTRAWALVDRPPETWFAGICDTTHEDPNHPGTTYACGWELRPRLTEATTRCPGCGTTHNVHTQRARLIARMADTLVTATDAARALSTPDRPITGDMIRSWRHRGHLEPATITDPDTGSTRPAYDHAGRPLYRLGDVQTIDNRLRWGDTTSSSTGRAS